MVTKKYQNYFGNLLHKGKKKTEEMVESKWK